MSTVKWIPVEERLPEKSGYVLCFAPYVDIPELADRGYIARVQYSAKHKAFNACDCQTEPVSAFHNVTHWAEDIQPPEGYEA